MNKLSQYKNNITSQNGEDGIIQEIFKRIGVTNKYCIEFGAWDGMYLSNVWNLWNNYDWNALLIEADEEKVNSLKESTYKFNKVLAYQAFVKAVGDTSVDEIVKKTNAPLALDLLSIDIDGDDYFIFKELKEVSPRVIIVEYNSTIPPYVELIQKPGEYMGSSALSFVKLAHEKHYKLAAITDTNLFFVKDSDFDALEIEEVDINVDFPSSHLVYVYSSFDGKMYLDKEPPYALKGLSSLRASLFSCIQANPWLKKFIFKRLYFPAQKLPLFNSSIKENPVRIFKND